VVKKDSEKPKRAPTAYFIFLADFRKEMAKSENKDEKGGQKIPSLAGEKWRSMGDKEKEPFVKKEAEEKKKYEVAMEEYRKKVPLFDCCIKNLVGSYSKVFWYL
jgi:hypothetical protein